MKEFVAAIVKRDGKFLVLREANRPQYWNFPGGKIEVCDSEGSGLTIHPLDGSPEYEVRGHPYFNAVSRELYEEMGLTAKIIEYAYEREVHVDGVDWIGYYYRVAADGEARIREPTKCLEMEWATEDQLPCREGLLDK